MTTRQIAGVGLALVLLAAFPVASLGGYPGVGGGGSPQPLLLRLTGFVGEPPTNADPMARVTLGIGQRTVVTMALTAIQIMNGPLTEGPAALEPFVLYEPNLLLVGDPALLVRLQTWSPNVPAVVYGYLRGGSRRMVIVAVDSE